MDTSEAGRKGGNERSKRWKGTEKAAAASRKGGKARAKKIGKARCVEIARNAALAMWAKRRAAAALALAKQGTGRVGRGPKRSNPRT